jgi:hypothetical protein
VLQAETGVRHLAIAGFTAQLFDKFRALSEAGGAQWVAFRQ